VSRGMLGRAMHPATLVWGLIILTGVCLAFLALRELVCWYWKLNELVRELEYQTGYLRSIDRGITQLEERLSRLERAGAPEALPAPPFSPPSDN